MKKLILLTLISLTANSYCAETKQQYDDEVDFNKEFTVIGNLVYQGIEGGVWLINNQYAIDKEVTDKLKKNKKYKFCLKKENVASCTMCGTPVEVISFEEIEKEASGYDLMSLYNNCSIQ